MLRLARSLCARSVIATGSLAACAAPWHAPAIESAAACPRDAERGATNRCVCNPGRMLLMGACVAPALGDAFCGSAARAGAVGCSFRACPGGQRLDVASGECAGASGLGFAGCGEHELPLLESEQVSCVPPDATCPRDTRRIGGVCARAPSCPPGSLPDQGSCRVVVTVGAGGRSVVDVGVWTALAIGIDGGLGSQALCRPLTQRPALFGVAPENPPRVDLQVALTVPDQDVSALSARIAATGPGGLPLSPAAEAVATEATTTLLELLRSLGGESSAAAVGVRVRCELGVR
jgi:hypothetical protein